MKVLIAILTLLTFSMSGTYVQAKENRKQPPPATAAAERQLWQSIGYGHIIEIEGQSVKVYSYTKDSLVPFGKGNIENNGDIYINEIYGNTKTQEQFNAPRYLMGRFVNGSLTDGLGYVQHLKRIDNLPKVKYNGFSNDPVQNFEVFWQSFEENFSFFPLVKVNWKEVYKEYRPKVSAATSEKELEDILTQMFQKLNDGHSVIFGKKGMIFSKSKVEREEFFEANSKSMQRNVEDGYMKGAVKSKLDGRIVYGQTKSGGAYIKLIGFDESDPQKIDRALAEMVQDLANCRNFMIDMRFNEGGEDFFGLKIAGLFAEKRTLAYAKQVRTGGYEQFSKPTQVYIEPGAKQFSADNIVVLTSPITVSAGETGTMALKALDKVTVIGEKTCGYFSDMLLRLLPNKQLFTLSNERYTSPDGTNYEQRGLPPDEKIMIKQADIDAGKDPVMNRALELLKKKP